MSVPCEACTFRTNPAFRDFSPPELEFISAFKSGELNAEVGRRCSWVSPIKYFECPGVPSINSAQEPLEPSPLRPPTLCGEPFAPEGHSRMKLQHSSRVDTLPQVTSPNAGSRAQDPSRGRILIVEDDYLVALQFENALTEAGYDVVDIASTAEEAVQLVPDHQPELVLMDVRLAGPRGGIQAAAEVLGW